MTSKKWAELLINKREEVLDAMEKADRDACKCSHLHFAVAMQPDGTIYSWYYVGNYSEPDSVWDGTDLYIYGASDASASWYDRCMEGYPTSRAAYCQYLHDGETIPENIDDCDIYDYVDKYYPHCIEEFDEDAIDWIVDEGRDAREYCLDQLIAGLDRDER